MECKGRLFVLKVPGEFKFPSGSCIAISEPDEAGMVEVLPDPQGMEPQQAPQRYVIPVAWLGVEEGRISEDALASLFRTLAIEAGVRSYRETSRIKPFSPGMPVPYAARVYDDREIAGLLDASLEFFLTAGRFARSFEEGLARFLDIPFCVLVNSGSSANLLAFMALTSPLLGERRIQRGDEIITVAAAFPTTVAPVIQYGAVPVFVDIRLPGYNIDPGLLNDALSERTRAVFIAHTLGNPFDIQAVGEFCRANKLWLIEDNCDALGSRYCLEGAWRSTGSFGHVGTSSFYPPHHITMGEGGAVYTSDPLLRDIVISLRDWGRDCWCPPGRDNTCKKRFSQQFGTLPMGYDHKYVYSHLGYNLKATDLQAAIGCAQLEKLPRFIAARRENWQKFREGLSELSPFFVLPEATEYSEPSWFGFLLTIKEEAPFSRDEIVRHLEMKGIQTRMLFAGNIIRHPCFDEMRKSREGFRVASGLDETDRVMRDTFWFGVYPGLTAAMRDFITEELYRFTGAFQ
ncbi:MAG: lipopolysaccharide biosynthesis protein RfbH [Candidatus Eremiobacteraeota bacterium]|nr:lipopolysaccharide biosynthesis protein RfbH [Candidatus Eremiobacteraeota bacterium]